MQKGGFREKEWFKVYMVGLQLIQLNIKKPNKPNNNWAEVWTNIFIKKKYSWPQAHEKMINNVNQRTGSPIHNEISPHTCHGYHQNSTAGIWRIWREGNPPTLLVGMQIGVATVESSMEVLQNTKQNYYMIQNSSPGWNLRKEKHEF